MVQGSTKAFAIATMFNQQDQQPSACCTQADQDADLSLMINYIVGRSRKEMCMVIDCPTLSDGSRRSSDFGTCNIIAGMLQNPSKSSPSLLLWQVRSGRCYFSWKRVSHHYHQSTTICSLSPPIDWFQDNIFPHFDRFYSGRKIHHN